MVVENSGTVSVRDSLSDGRVNSRIANYTAFFEADSKNDSEEHKKNRLENYTDVVNGKPFCQFEGFLLKFNRILRWRHRAVRIWLEQIIPFLSFL